MTCRQGGIKLCFLSSLSLTLALSFCTPSPTALSLIPWLPLPCPLTGKANWALENIYEQGRAICLRSFDKGGRKGVREVGRGGRKKKRTWQRHGDKGKDGVYILMFKFNLPHTRWILRLSSYCYVSSVFRCACQYCTYTLYLGGVESTQVLRKALQIEASFSLGLTHSVGASRGNKGTFTDP